MRTTAGTSAHQADRSHSPAPAAAAATAAAAAATAVTACSFAISGWHGLSITCREAP